MVRSYQVKFKKDRSIGVKYFGGMGFEGPMTWDALVSRVAERGIQDVEKIRHANSYQLNRDEILELWKEVDSKELVQA